MEQKQRHSSKPIFISIKATGLLQLILCLVLVSCEDDKTIVYSNPELSFTGDSVNGNVIFLNKSDTVFNRFFNTGFTYRFNSLEENDRVFFYYESLDTSQTTKVELVGQDGKVLTTAFGELQSRIDTIDTTYFHSLRVDYLVN